MSKKIIVANWKMNPKTLKEAEALLARVLSKIKKTKKADVIICPPLVYISTFFEKIKKTKTPISLGAQTISCFDSGTHTGEVSAAMVKSVGAEYVIIGHSERRIAGETDEMVNQKIILALRYGLTVILAVGETEESDDAHTIIQKQLSIALQNIPGGKIYKILFAYEPRWAISKGRDDKSTKSDTPGNALEKSIVIKKVLAKLYNSSITKKVRILYGGSLRVSNAAEFINPESGFDGALIGGSSLDPKSFSYIVSLV